MSFVSSKRGDLALRRASAWISGHHRQYEHRSRCILCPWTQCIEYRRCIRRWPIQNLVVWNGCHLRWRPLQRSIYHSFVGRSEVIWSRRDQPNGLQRSLGYYISGDYQFARRWFAGLRYRLVQSGGQLVAERLRPVAVLTYWPSEFSQIRGQYRRTQYADGPTANEFLLQFHLRLERTARIHSKSKS